jgi:hypothetical protein
MRPVVALMLKPAGRPRALKRLALLLAVTWKLKAVLTVPLALAALVMDGGAGRTRIVRLAEPVPPALVAEIFAVKLPAAVGVPVMRPFVALMLKPAGRPLALNAVALLLAVIWKLKAVPTEPLALAALVIAGRTGRIRISRLAEPAPPALVAEMFAVKLPAAVGVPVMRPFLALIVKPAGRPLALNVVALLLAVTWKEKAVPTVPLALTALVMAGRAGKIRMARLADPLPPALAAETFAVKLPAAVGVPVIKPLVALMVKPAGRPLALNAVALLLAVTWKLKAVPTDPLALATLVMEGRAGRVTWIRSVAFPVPPALVAEMFAVKLPAEAGVPEINPVEVLIVRLPGRPVAPNDVALLLAVIW